MKPSRLSFIGRAIRFTFLNNYIAFKFFIMKKLLFILPVFCYTVINGQNVFTITAGTTISDDQGWVGGGQRVITLENMDLINESESTRVNIRFSGNTNSTISGSSPNYVDGRNYNGFEIAKTGGARLILSQHLTVWGQVIFTSGNLDLNGHVLNLYNAGEFVSESENSRMVAPSGGYVQYYQDYHATAPGWSTGVSFSNLDSVASWVMRGHLTFTGNLGTGSSIQRYLYFGSNTIWYGQVPSVSVRMKYFESELNGLNENDLVFWTSFDRVNWTNESYTTRNTIDNYVELSNSTNFPYKYYTLAPAGSPRSTTSAPPAIKTMAVPAKETITNKWKTWPNPADKILSIDITSTSASLATTSIFDSKGSLIRTQTNHLMEGGNRLKMDLKNLPAGIYYVTTNWDAGKEKRSSSFIKR